MKRFLSITALVLLTACAAPGSVPTATPNDQAALCIQGVTTVRKAATATLRAGKITLEQDREIQAGLDTSARQCRLMTGVAQ